MARKTAEEIRQMLRAHFPGQQGELLVRVFDAMNTDMTTVEANVTALDAWGTALATKLNADAGVTDTDYDTTPLA